MLCAPHLIRSQSPLHLSPLHTVQRASMSACCRVLTLLTWRIGCLLLCGASALVGSFPFVAPFAELPLMQREIVLQSWATSSIASFRKVHSQPKVAADTSACCTLIVHNAVMDGSEFVIQLQYALQGRMQHLCPNGSQDLV